MTNHQITLSVYVCKERERRFFHQYDVYTTMVYNALHSTISSDISEVVNGTIAQLDDALIPLEGAPTVSGIEVSFSDIRATPKGHFFDPWTGHEAQRRLFSNVLELYAKANNITYKVKR